MGEQCCSQKTWLLNEGLSAKLKISPYKFIREVPEVPKIIQVLPLLLAAHNN